MKQKRSLRFFIYIFFLLLILLVGISLLFYSVVLQRQAQWQISQTMTPIMRVLANTLSSDMERAEDYLEDMATNNELFLHLGSKGDMTQVYAAAEQLGQTFTPLLSANKCITCVCVFSNETGIYHAAYGSLRGNTGWDRVDLKNDMKEVIMDHIDDGSLNEDQWHIFTVNTHYFLCRAIDWRETYCICLIDLSQVADDLAVRFGLPGQVVFTLGGIALTDVDSGLADYTWTGKEDSFCQVGDFYITESTAGVVDLAYVLPRQAMSATVNVMQLLLVVLFTILLISTVTGFAYMRTAFILPMNDLLNTMDRIQGGDWDSKLDENIKATEFQAVNSNFNRMVRTITQMRIEAYEQALEMERAESTALKLQIRPHFFLATLKIIYAQAAVGKTKEIQNKILYLSKHLRYVFTEYDEIVPLSKELELCRNYIQMLSIDSENPPGIQIDVDPSLLELSVPPVSLLTLVENSIKHKKEERQCVHIRIAAHTLRSEDTNLILLTVQDNGRGFPEEMLRDLNSLDSSHVGITNFVRRMKLLYGDCCEVAFSNQGGAQVDVFIPEGGVRRNESIDR